MQEGVRMKKIQDKTNRASKMFCSKKADISIVLLVLMTLALMGATLLIFLLSGKIDKKISDAKFLEATYAIENKIDFYLADAIEMAVAKAYKEVAEEQAFVGRGCSTLPEKIDVIEKEFCRVDSNINVVFKEKITSYFKDNIKALELPDSETILNGMKNNVEQNKFSIEFDGKNAVLNVKDISINSQFTKKKTIKIFWIIPAGEEITTLIGVNYKPDIMTETELSDLELSDFETIYQKAAECAKQNSLSSCDDAEKEKKTEGFKTCINEKLAGFVTDAEARCNVFGVNAYYLTAIKSKKEFLIDKSFETIGIKFLMKAE